MFDHFLITRFNLKSAEWKVSRSGKQVLTDDWLKYRFYLFEKFTLPSVLNQSCTNFRWLIYFDIDTPDIYLKRAIVLNEHPSISVFFIRGMNVFLKEIISSIEQLKDPSKLFLITTRLDNDDLIHRDFIKKIQESFIPESGTLIDLRRGYQLNLEKNGKSSVRHFFDFYTHYLSLIEYSLGFKTIFSRIIDDWQLEKRVIVQHEHPLFIETVHGENLVNTMKSHQPYLLNFRGADFGIEPKTLRLRSFFWVIIKNRTYYLKRIRLISKSRKLKI